jgi:hypothetical protein
MIRLGWRLVVAGGRSSAVVTGLTALSVAFGTAILLFALSFEPALQVRYDHAAWRDTPGELDLATADRGLMLARTDDHWQGRPLVRMDVAALSPNAPVPPGLDHVPAAGQAYVSPALASLVAATPPDELGDRFGAISGAIADTGLMAPDELAVIVGRAPADLRAEGARVVTSLAGSGKIPMPRNPLIQVLVLVAVIGALAPVAVLVATATRLSAARRERRLAALRLAGATPWQVTVAAAVEALAATVPGALGGVLVFFALRPLIARVPLMGATWFPESIAPPIGPAIALLAVVPVVGVAAAVVALRRLSISPLGVQRRERPGPLRRLRLAPLAAMVAAFVALLVAIVAGGAAGQTWMLWALGGSFLGIIVGVAYAGPWVTLVVGSAITRLARGPIGLLAGRRLVDDPRASFRAIGGVVMAVFVGSAYLSIASTTSSLVSSTLQLAVSRDVLEARLTDGALAEQAATRLRTTTGVAAVAVLREIVVQLPDAPDGSTPPTAVISDCRSFIAVLAATDVNCGPGLEHLGPGGTPITTGTAIAFGFLSTYPVIPVGPAGNVSLAIPSDRIDRYAPDDTGSRAANLPAVLIEPAALGAALASLPATRLIVRTDGSPTATERARTIIEAAMPTSVVATIGEEAADGSASLSELGRVVSLGVVVAMVIAGASLAIAVVTGLLERRMPFALLRLAGMPVRRLQAVLLVEAAAPLAAVAVLSAVLGTLVAQLLIRAILASRADLSLPVLDGGVVGLLIVAMASALAVVAAALPLVGPITETQETRFE